MSPPIRNAVIMSQNRDKNKGLSRARAQGWEAAEVGQPRSANPYIVPRYRDAWFGGWDEAQGAMKNVAEIKERNHDHR